MRTIGRVLAAAGAILAFGLTGLTTAQGQAQARFITEYRLDRNIIEIPFEYVNHQIVVHGETDQKKDLTFLFDSGASSPVVDKALGVSGYHLADSKIQEAEGITQGEMIWLGGLQLGADGSAVKVANIPTLVTDLSQMSKLLKRKIDGIVGISFMGGYVIEIDYVRHLLRFHDQRDFNVASRAPDNQRTFLFSLAQGDPRRKVSVVFVSGQLHDKYDYDFLVDTGFGGYVSVGQSAARESGLITPTTPRVPTNNFSVSRQFHGDKIRAKYLMLGEINLSGRIIQVDSRNQGGDGQFGIVGNRLLQNYRVTLDYPHRKLWLERVSTVEEEDEADKPLLGLSIRAENGVVRVARVSPNSPAYQSGVRAGDELRGVNGQSSARLTLAGIRRLLFAPQGAMTLSLTRGVDPNLGLGGDNYTLTLLPQSPLEWLPEAPGREFPF